MKAITLILLLCLCGHQVEARNSGVSLNEAVNQAKSEGRVLSAKTVNGRHEIKVLTASGTVKVINKQAGRTNLDSGNNGYKHQGPKTSHNQYQEPNLPNRLKTNRNQMKLKESNARSNRENNNRHNMSQRPHSKRSRGNGNNTKNKDN